MSQLQAKPLKSLNDNLVTYCFIRRKTLGHFLANLTNMRSRAETVRQQTSPSTELPTGSVDKGGTAATLEGVKRCK